MFRKNNTALRENFNTSAIKGVEEFYYFLEHCKIHKETLWDSMLCNLKDQLLALERLDYFLQVPEIQRSVHPYQPKLAKKYMKALLDGDYCVKDYASMSEDEFGKPNRLLTWPNMSSQLVQHNYHIHILKKYLFNDDTPSSVVEFGGGYGSIAKLIMREIGVSQYTIVDLELMCEIQKFYLKNTLEDKYFARLSWQDSKKASTDFIEDSCLFLATWSISECPIEVRDVFLKNINSYDFVCITFQKSWEKVDNYEYFVNLFRGMQNNFDETHFFECSVFKDNYYLLAKK